MAAPATVAPLDKGKPKLVYFNFPGGLGEPIRLAFVLGGIDFEDVRINFDDWPKEKPKFPLGTLPVLQADGATMTQSAAILRRVARQANLLPSNQDDIDHGEVVCEACRDVNRAVMPTMGEKICGVVEITPEQKKAMREWMAGDVLPKIVKLLESCLRGDYFCGDKITMCDLMAYVTLRWLKSGTLDDIPPSIVSAKLVDFVDRMEKHKKIAEWNAAKH